jgi:hypothetical protein
VVKVFRFFFRTLRREIDCQLQIYLVRCCVSSGNAGNEGKQKYQVKLPIRLATIAPITLAGMITVLPCFASDASEIDYAKIASYRQKIQSHRQELFSISKNSPSVEEREYLGGIVRAVLEIEGAILNVQTLLRIKSSMHDEADKQVVSKFISDEIEVDLTGITETLDEVNDDMAHIKSPAGVTGASKLMDDLRGLKELLKSRDSS